MTKRISNRTRKLFKRKRLTNVCRNLTFLEEKRGQFLQGKKACSYMWLMCQTIHLCSLKRDKLEAKN